MSDGVYRPLRVHPAGFRDVDCTALQTVTGEVLDEHVVDARRIVPRLPSWKLPGPSMPSIRSKRSPATMRGQESTRHVMPD